VSPAKARSKTPPLVLAAQRLKRAVADYPARAPLGSAEYVLDPLDYAWKHHRAYLERYGPREPGAVEAMLVGMNPGPWGMAQTGVPFGSPDVVRDFLGIHGPVKAPASTHPKRPILGWSGTRTEVSGRRLWGGVRDCFGTPEAFFARFFVANYCPLVFQSETGANLTPDKLPAAALADCYAACEDHMARVIEACAPRTVIGVGKWAEKQVKAIVAARGLDVEVASILHPSPASPAANRGWLPQARKQLAALGHPWPEPREDA
jgi:single-strand selective monofunctional uracil DNA glycosylase